MRQELEAVLARKPANAHVAGRRFVRSRRRPLALA